MRWIPVLYERRHRTRIGSLPGAIEFLETHAPLADGITAAAGPPIDSVAGVPITDAVFATFTVTDSSGQPGTLWLALISFDDGQFDRQVARSSRSLS